jgi:hypothetical protein
MTQAALIKTPVSMTQSDDDPLIDVIKSFGTRAEAFSQDLTQTIEEYLDTTLYDAMLLREGAEELKTLIGILTKRHEGLLKMAQEIINNNQAAGHIKEGNLEIVPKESQGRRSVDRDRLIQERPDVYNQLLNTKIESIKIEYTPTIADLKTLLKKRHEEYLKPGEISIIYDIEIILEEGENDN